MRIYLPQAGGVVLCCCSTVTAWLCCRSKTSCWRGAVLWWVRLRGIIVVALAGLILLVPVRLLVVPVRVVVVASLPPPPIADPLTAESRVGEAGGRATYCRRVSHGVHVQSQR